MPQISIVIPAYNEEAAIGSVLDALFKLNIDAEIIVVDDGSSDRTAEIAKAHGARVIRHPQNMGYGMSVKDAVRVAITDTILLTDADGTYPIDRIPDLVTMFNQGYDMTVGARQGAAYRGTFLKMPARYVFKFLVEMTTGRHIPDINSGLRIFRKSTSMKYFADICDGFSFTTTITLIYMLTGKSVSYMPIDYFKRIGKSKVKMIRDSLRTLQYITECIVRYNPLKLFLLLSAITVFLGIAAGSMLGPYAFLLGVFFAMVVFAQGLIAESMRRPRE